MNFGLVDRSANWQHNETYEWWERAGSVVTEAQVYDYLLSYESHEVTDLVLDSVKEQINAAHEYKAPEEGIFQQEPEPPVQIAQEPEVPIQGTFGT